MEYVVVYCLGLLTMPIIFGIFKLIVMLFNKKGKNKNEYLDVFLNELPNIVLEIADRFESRFYDARDRHKNIHNITYMIYNNMEDFLDEEYLDIFSSIDREYIQKFIYNVIDSNYDDIFKFNINKTIDENIIEIVNDNRAKKENAQNILGAISNFYISEDDNNV